jgi:ATP-dependent exoDNAse (exonuclease V) beta subunit
MQAAPFDLYNDPLLPGIHAIEASAGTGKTYTLAQLLVRLVVEKAIPIDQILVVTFTRAAAAELRERIHRRLTEVELALHTPRDSIPTRRATVCVARKGCSIWRRSQRSTRLRCR